jgi:hypothetical protein
MLTNVEKLAFDDRTLLRPPADFDGDFHNDVLPQRDDGAVAIWSMDGAAVTDGGILPGNPGNWWHVI